MKTSSEMLNEIEDFPIGELNEAQTSYAILQLTMAAKQAVIESSALALNNTCYILDSGISTDGSNISPLEAEIILLEELSNAISRKEESVENVNAEIADTLKLQHKKDMDTFDEIITITFILLGLPVIGLAVIHAYLLMSLPLTAGVVGIALGISIAKRKGTVNDSQLQGLQNALQSLGAIKEEYYDYAIKHLGQ